MGSSKYAVPVPEPVLAATNVSPTAYTTPVVPAAVFQLVLPNVLIRYVALYAKCPAVVSGNESG